MQRKYQKKTQNRVAKELKLREECSANCKKFVSILTKFKRMCDSHMMSIIVEQHLIELEKMNNRPIHSAPYGR